MQRSQRVAHQAAGAGHCVEGRLAWRGSVHAHSARGVAAAPVGCGTAATLACCVEHKNCGVELHRVTGPLRQESPPHCCRACGSPSPPRAADCNCGAPVWVRLQSQHHRRDALNKQRTFRQAVGCRRTAAAGRRAAAVHAAGRAGAPGDLHAGRQVPGGLHRPHPDDVRLGPAPLRPCAS